MNKDQNSDDAIKDLEQYENLSILEKTDEEKDYLKLRLKTSKMSELIKKMKKENYSEFVMGAIIGMELTLMLDKRSKQNIKDTTPKITP